MLGSVFLQGIAGSGGQALCRRAGLKFRRISQAAQLHEALDALVEVQSQGLSSSSSSRRKGRHAVPGRRLRRGRVGAQAELAEQNKTEESQDFPVDPTHGLVARQQAAYSQRLLEDRKLIWLQESRALNDRLAEAMRPQKPEQQDAIQLPSDVVQGIFDEMAVDPAAELIQRRDVRIQENLAVQLEQLIACEPPAALVKALQAALPPGGNCRKQCTVRLSGVSVASDMEAHHSQLATGSLIGPRTAKLGRSVKVFFETPPGLEASWLQQQLNAVSPALSQGLARRHLLGGAPLLHFEPVHSELVSAAPAAAAPFRTAGRRAVLWRNAKRGRRLTVHGAMQSWKADMHW